MQSSQSEYSKNSYRLLTIKVLQLFKNVHNLYVVFCKFTAILSSHTTKTTHKKQNPDLYVDNDYNVLTFKIDAHAHGTQQQKKNSTHI